MLGTSLPKTVTVNELTTVASAFTAARFINGESISGNPLGLRIAAGNVPNLVDPATGGWGKVILDPINSTQTTTLANLNTLGSLISAFVTVANDDWRARFFKAATPPSGVTPKNTLEAMAGIARAPWAQPKSSLRCSTKPIRSRRTARRRKAPFVPYLAYVPADFALVLCFAGGGMLAAASSFRCGRQPLERPELDARLAVRRRQQHRRRHDQVRAQRDRRSRRRSPVSQAWALDGVGWGTGVSLDKVWVGGLNGTILVMDFNGKADRPRKVTSPWLAKLGGLMGIGVAANGDVWIADGTKNQLLYFPGGRVKDGRIVKVAGLKSPFGVAIDAQNRVWVSNSQSDTVVRFPANDPSKVETFRGRDQRPRRRLGLEGQSLGGKQHVSGFPPAGHPRRRIHHGAVSDRRCSTCFKYSHGEPQDDHRRRQYDPPGRHPAGAEGLHRQQRDQRAVGRFHRRQ